MYNAQEWKHTQHSNKHFMGSMGSMVTSRAHTRLHVHLLASTSWCKECSSSCFWRGRWTRSARERQLQCIRLQDRTGPYDSKARCVTAVLQGSCVVADAGGQPTLCSDVHPRAGALSCAVHNAAAMSRCSVAHRRVLTFLLVAGPPRSHRARSSAPSDAGALWLRGCGR